MRLFSQIRDVRAFAGAISLALVGVQLSVMMAFYFIPGGEIFAVFQSRWWWEVALNLQILCFFLMYLCHSVRVKATEGWRKVRAYWRFCVGMLGVSVPSWVTVIAATNNWFREPPQQEDLIFFTWVVFVVWFFSAYFVPACSLLFFENQTLSDSLERLKNSNKKFALFLSPLVVLIILFGIELMLGGHSHIILWPFLTYFYGSLHYFWAAYVLPARRLQHQE